MLLRLKTRDWLPIIFWLLSIGRVVDGNVNNDLNDNMVEHERTLHSERTTSAQDNFKRSLNYIEDQGGGAAAGTTYDDFEDEDHDDDLRHIHHRNVSKPGIP